MAALQPTHFSVDFEGFTARYNEALLNVGKAAEEGKGEVSESIDAFAERTSEICGLAQRFIKVFEFVQISQEKMKACLDQETHLSDEGKQAIIRAANKKFAQIIISHFTRLADPDELIPEKINGFLSLVQRYDPSLKKQDLIDGIRDSLKDLQKAAIRGKIRVLKSGGDTLSIMVAQKAKAAENLLPLRKKRVEFSLQLLKIKNHLKVIAELPELGPKIGRLPEPLVPVIQGHYLNGLPQSPEAMEKEKSELESEIEQQRKLVTDPVALKAAADDIADRRIKFLKSLIE